MGLKSLKKYQSFFLAVTFLFRLEHHQYSFYEHGFSISLNKQINKPFNILLIKSRKVSELKFIYVLKLLLSLSTKSTNHVS